MFSYLPDEWECNLNFTYPPTPVPYKYFCPMYMLTQVVQMEMVICSTKVLSLRQLFVVKAILVNVSS